MEFNTRVVNNFTCILKAGHDGTSTPVTRKQFLMVQVAEEKSKVMS